MDGFTSVPSLQEAIDDDLNIRKAALKFHTHGGAREREFSFWLKAAGRSYSVNPKELEKFLLGMHYRHSKGMNDHYEKGGGNLTAKIKTTFF